MAANSFFSSVKLDTVLKIEGSNDKVEAKYFKMLEAQKTSTGYTKAQPLTSLVYNGEHVTNGNFSPDGSKFYFTLCEENADKISRCDIYVAEVQGVNLLNAKKLPDVVNNPGSTNSQPTLGKSSDGNDVLYFVSNRENGKGGLDIWYSTMDKTGTYKQAKNAGSKINSDRDEYSPFFDAQSKQLFFSTNGRIGLGGFDVYSANGELQKWEDPQNLGKPINSSVDDMYYRVNKTGDYGFVVSNRPGTMSVRSQTCCDDIFEVKYDKVINIAVMGHVYDADDPKKTPLANSLVTLSIKGATEYGNIGTDSTEKTSPYFFRLNPGEEYKVVGLRSGYLTGNATFNSKNINTSDTIIVDIPVKKITIGKEYRLNNVYYDFDKWDLRPESKKTLDTLYEIMIDNPTIIVELGSHTDSRGTDEYNLSLSQKRAESCVNYLIKEKGIPAERIKPKGYGETKHLDDCSKYAECPNTASGDCPCHQLNRRTEFKIIGELDANLIYDDKRSDQ